MDNILHVERSLQMAKAHVGMMPTNPAISEHKEMHILSSYGDTIRTRMQRRHQDRLCKKKNYPRLKTTGEPKTSQGTTRSYMILQEFIRYYSDMTYPLEELLREDQEYDWTEECNI